MVIFQMHSRDVKRNFLSFLSHLIGYTPTIENREIVIALNAIGADVGFIEITSDKGHDSFLLDVPDFLNTIKNFLNNSYKNINETRI